MFSRVRFSTLRRRTIGIIAILFLLFQGSSAAAPRGYTHVTTLKDGTKVYASRVKMVAGGHYSAWLMMNEEIVLFEFRKVDGQVSSRFLVSETNQWEPWSLSPPGSFGEGLYENLAVLHEASIPAGFEESSVNIDGTKVYVHLKSSVALAKNHFRARVMVSTMERPVLIELRKIAGELQVRGQAKNGWSPWKKAQKGSNYDNVYGWLYKYHRKEGGPYGILRTPTALQLRGCWSRPPGVRQPYSGGSALPVE